MNKPWDFKALLEALKKEGLPVAEVGVKKATTVIFEWVEKSVMLMSPFYGAIIIPFLQTVKPRIFAEIDKIDGIKGN